MEDMKLREFRDLYLCNFTPWEQETNIECPSCGYPHMDFTGETKDGFPKFKCSNCKVRADKSPRNIEARRRIDHTIAHNLINRF